MAEKSENILKNVGLFTDSFSPMIDGVATVVKNYAIQMHQKGISVSVFAPSCRSAANEQFTVLRYASLPLPFRKPYRLSLSLLNQNFYKQFARKKFDIIHAHSPFFSGNIALKFAKKNNIPLVATFHSKFKDNFSQLISSKYIVNQIIKRIISFYEQADEVWIPQAAVEQTMREYGYKGKVEVVENGCYFIPSANIDLIKTFARKQIGILPDETVYLFTGQMTYEKNIEMIINALVKIKHTNFKMFFIGTGYAATNFQKMVNSLNLNDKVQFTGLISEREKLSNYYAAANLFVFPSLYDTSGIVVHEAAAFATPSVIVKNSTLSEIIRDNENGFLIENTVLSLAEKLLFLQNEKDKIAQVGRAAQATIPRSWMDITDEVTERYISLIKRKNIK